eukprot:TRINITY_DN4760_c0_g1_i3.p1 TRINITY_DN4760_c0_g1~~TRINITY_DN4760_c0_g1_i3.p1  ORF type:complete len:112 (-),score=18.40 TRINITY_DN4760_c0_g1_i3:124-459(-)
MSRKVWEDNTIFVDGINANHSFKLEVNKFGDLTHEEFSTLYLLSQDTRVDYRDNASLVEIENSGDLPSSWDWREYGAVTPVKDQVSSYLSTNITEFLFDYTHTYKLIMRLD